jgi:hypothetical protein
MVATAPSTPQLALHGKCRASHKASANASFCLDGFLGKTRESINLSVLEREAWEAEAGVNLD